MKGDFTRRTFKPFRSYSSVLMQQGRVQLDSDWNEQAEIGLAREQRMLRDIIGPNGTGQSGTYATGGPFHVRFLYNHVLSAYRAVIDYSVDDDSSIFSNRFYLNGELIEQVYAEVPAKNGEEVSHGNDITYEVSSTTLPDGRQLKVGMFILSARGDSWGYRRKGPISAISGNNVTMYAEEITEDQPATDCRIVALYEYLDQPYYVNPPDLPTSGTYVAYLDVWRRHVTATESPSLREAALGGADTATRTQTVWQLKFVAATEAEASGQGWKESLLRKYPGPMTARYNPTPGQVQSLENRLYRVEIHKGGKPSAGTPMAPTVTFKWSRDNGAQAAPWLGDNGPLRVGTQGREEALGFAAGQWIELSDDERDFKNLPGAFVQISAGPSAAPGGQFLPVAMGTDTNFANYHGNPKVRRWDSAGSATYPLDAKPASPMNPWIPLENGIEVMFDPDAEYQTGDYWLIPARPNLGGIEWPQTGGQPAPQPAQFTEHSYQAMNFVDFSTTPPTVAQAIDSSLSPNYQQDKFYSLKELTHRVDQIKANYYTNLSLTSFVQSYIKVAPGTGMPTGDSGSPLKLAVDDTAERSFYLLCNTTSAVGVAPINLPDRTLIDKIKITYKTYGSGDIQYSVYRIYRLSGVSEHIATRNTGSSGGAMANDEISPASIYIYNSDYTYWIYFNCANLAKIYGVRLECQIPGLG